MNVSEFIIEILEKTKGRSYLDVAIDSGVPKPFEDLFEIIIDKGFLLFKAKKVLTEIGPKKVLNENNLRVHITR